MENILGNQSSYTLLHLPLITRSALKEPTSYKQAAKDPKWVAAMEVEVHALHTNQTWTLVPSQPTMNAIGCKWVYNIKQHHDGILHVIRSD